MSGTEQPTPEQVERMAKYLYLNTSGAKNLRIKFTDLNENNWNDRHYIPLARYVLSLLLPAAEALERITSYGDDRSGCSTPSDEDWKFAEAALAQARQEQREKDAKISGNHVCKNLEEHCPGKIAEAIRGQSA